MPTSTAAVARDPGAQVFRARRVGGCEPQEHGQCEEEAAQQQAQRRLWSRPESDHNSTLGRRAEGRPMGRPSPEKIPWTTA